MQHSAKQAAGFLQSLASEKRLMILCQIWDADKKVGEIAQSLGISQSNVSQQLALLRKDGLVQARRQGQSVYYSLAGDDARRIIDLLYDLYCRPSKKLAARSARK